MAFSITKSCVNCFACLDVCPNEAILEASPHFRIEAKRCTECEGAYADPQCASICPIEGAIVDGFGAELNPPGSLSGLPLAIAGAKNPAHSVSTSSMKEP